MKLKIIAQSKKNKNTVLISKTGVLRFSRQIAERNNFKKEDKWLIAIDEEENPKKHIYILKQNNALDKNGKKMQLINNSWNLNCKPLLEELNIKESLRCECEKIKIEAFNGFSLKINE